MKYANDDIIISRCLKLKCQCACNPNIEVSTLSTRLLAYDNNQWSNNNCLMKQRYAADDN